MKLLIVLMLGIAGRAQAEPYFRFTWIDKAPKPGIGSLLDVRSLKKTDAAIELPLITHSFRDGYLVIPGEDWSLLNAGIGGTAGDVSIVVGPAANLLPPMQIGIATVLDFLNPTGEKFQALRNLIRPASAEADVVSISVGPQWVFKPLEGAHGHGYARLWTGAAYQF